MGLISLVLVLVSCSLVFATTGVDFSTGISASSFSCLVSSGYVFGVTRAFQSNGVPDPNACNNIRNAHSGGMQYVDVYLFPCPTCGSSGQSQVSSMVNALASNGCTPNTGTQGTSNYGMVWLDIEGTSYWSSQQSVNSNFFEELKSGCSQTGVVCAVYTSASQWNPIMGSYTGGGSMSLWYAHYDGNPSFSDFSPFGGWTKPSIKQYQGTTTVCSAGVDLDYY